MSTKPETVFRQRVRKDLIRFAQQGLPVFFAAIQQKTISGDPDFLLCLNGFFVALELKDIKGKVSALQEKKLELVAKANGIGFVVDKGNWPNVCNYFERLLRGEENDSKTDEHDSHPKGLHAETDCEKT